MGVSINGGIPKMMVYSGESHLNGWFGGTPISGNHHMLNLNHLGFDFNLVLSKCSKESLGPQA